MLLLPRLKESVVLIIYTNRQVRDDWGLRIQPVPKPESDR